MPAEQRDAVYRDVLDQAGVLQVDSLTDLIEAAEQIRVLQPDLVILDIQMPGRSGMEIARALRPGEHQIGRAHV